MTFCVGPIDGDGDTVDTCVVDFLCGFRGNQCAVGRERTHESLIVSVADEFVDVLAHHRVAAGEDDQRASNLGKRVDKAQSLFVVQFTRVGLEMGLGAAVLAGEVARAGDFPGDDAAGGGPVFKRFGSHAPARRAVRHAAACGRRGWMAHRASPLLRTVSVK